VQLPQQQQWLNLIGWLGRLLGCLLFDTDSPEESEADWMIASQLADVWGESELTESQKFAVW
jgi:hypothetical protein